MQIHRLDAEGDWSYGNGKFDLLQDDDAIILNINTRLNEWIGDCFFSVQSGVDWYNGLDRGTKVYLDNRIKEVITESYGVVQLLDFTSALNIKTRKLTVTYNITTIFSNSVKRQIEIGI